MSDMDSGNLWRDGLSGILRQFLQREASPAIQFLKYVIAGGTAVGVHMAIFYLVSWLLLPALQETDIVVRVLGITVTDVDTAVRARNAMINNWLAFLVSNLVAYLINAAWVFHPGRHHWFLALGMFYLASAAAIFLGTALMGLLIRYWHWSTTVAFSANLVTSLIINFTTRKFVIFKR